MVFREGFCCIPLPMMFVLSCKRASVFFVVVVVVTLVLQQVNICAGEGALLSVLCMGRKERDMCV